MATVTVNQIIISAFQLAGLASNTEQPTAEDIQQGLLLLNALLDGFATSPTQIPLNKQITFSTIPGKGRYTVSPTGVPDIIANKLLSIDFAVFRYLGMQYPLTVNNDYQHFNRIRNNQTSGWPTEIYVRPLEHSSEIYIYYKPNNVYEVEVSGKFVLDSVELQTDLSVVPANYHRFLIYALARDLVAYDSGAYYAPTAEAEYQRLLSEITDGNQKDLTVIGDSSLMFPGVYDATLFMGIGGAGGSDSNTGGAPSAAKYVIAQPHMNLPNAQALSLLPSGILKSQTNTGVVSTAIPGTDYLLPPAGTTPNTLARYGVNNQFLPSNVTLDADGNFGNVQNISGTMVNLSGSTSLRLNNVQFPSNTGLVGQVLGIVGSNQLGFLNVSGVGDVSSVFGRMGSIVSEAGDYTAAQITYIPDAGITSDNVQDAIDEVATDLNTHITNTSAHSATSANTPSHIVMRDGSGNFSAGTITANLIGNASTVTTNANLTGDVTSVGNMTAIAAGVIVDNDINASANIAQTKIAGLAASFAAKQDTADLNQPNGYCGLDVSGKVALAQLPSSVVGALNYQGIWDASTNTPTIPAASAGNKGWYYVVSVAGSTNIDGNSNWNVGDWIVSNGTTWDQIDNTDSVSTVFGRTGAIVASNGDYTASQITNVPAGNISATTVQAALNELDTEKQATLTGAASTVTTSNLTASLALISNASGKIDVSSVTSTELGYVSGVTSALQTQIDAKAPLLSPTFTGTPSAPTPPFGNTGTRLATTAYVRQFEAWQTPTLLNSWANVGGATPTAGFRRTPLGQVELKGLISGGSAGVIMALPSAYRPNSSVRVAVSARDSGGNPVVADIQMATGGNVTITPVPTGEVAINFTFSIDN